MRKERTEGALEVIMVGVLATLAEVLGKSPDEESFQHTMAVKAAFFELESIIRPEYLPMYRTTLVKVLNEMIQVAKRNMDGTDRSPSLN